MATSARSAARGGLAARLLGSTAPRWRRAAASAGPAHEPAAAVLFVAWSGLVCPIPRRWVAALGGLAGAVQDYVGRLSCLQVNNHGLRRRLAASQVSCMARHAFFFAAVSIILREGPRSHARLGCDPALFLGGPWGGLRFQSTAIRFFKFVWSF
jgi:hypothetical protein